MARRILLCDDEIHIMRAAQFKLVRAGFEVECASDGQLGWEAIQRQLPDILITDCQMPRLSGLGLIARVRGYEPAKNMPILMLTAKGFELSEQEMIERWNVLAVIGKPFSPRDLLDRVQHALGSATTSTRTVIEPALPS